MPRSRGGELSNKQQRFVKEYLVDLNGAQAAIRAGYPARSAKEAAKANMERPVIRAAIAEALAKVDAKLDISAERILTELARVAFSDLRAIYNLDGSMKPPHEWPDEVAATVAGLEIETKALGLSKVYKVKRWDKNRALEMLAKYRGLLKDQVEHTGEVAYRWIE